MKAKIYSHHLYEVTVINDEEIPNLFDFVSKPENIKFTFHSENCFSVQNGNNEYLTAFTNGEVRFYAKRCSTWEKFYILDTDCQKFINYAIDKQYRDARNNIIMESELFIENNKLLVTVGSTIITPSYFPAGKFEKTNNGIKYNTLQKNTILNQKRKLIYFCVYGKDIFYDCFYLSLKSLINFGKYNGDILIKTDNIEKCHKITEEFNNKFYYSEIDISLGIFNRYLLQEDLLYKYDSIIYLDCDILSINDVNFFLNKTCEDADFILYIEENNKNYQTNDTNDWWWSWWGINYIKYNADIKIDDYLMYNSGFFVINNLQHIQPIFDKIIEYRQFETYAGDQPFLNLGLYNSKIDIKGIEKNDALSFSRSMSQSFNALNKIWIHFNSGVGDLSKLKLMTSFYHKLEKNN